MAIRLVLVRLPRMLADVVRDAFTGVEELDVVTVDQNSGDLADAVAATRPTVVIAGVRGRADQEEAGALLAAHHDLVVLGVTPDAREAWLYELRPVARPLGQLSPDLLRRAVLDAVREKTS